MAIPSKYNGKCKDCTAPHKIGDLIERNNNDNWCKYGNRCQGAMHLQSSANPSDGYHAPSQEALDQAERQIKQNRAAELHKKYVELFPDKVDFIDHWESEGMEKAKNVIEAYIGTLELCEKIGITQPPVIGMIFNNVMRCIK